MIRAIRDEALSMVKLIGYLLFVRKVELFFVVANSSAKVNWKKNENRLDVRWK